MRFLRAAYVFFDQHVTLDFGPALDGVWSKIGELLFPW